MTSDLMRDVIEGRIPVPAKPKPPTLAQADLRPLAEAISQWAQEFAEAWRPLIETLQDIGIIATPPPADPRERALRAKQQRGTGPDVEALKERGRVTKYKEGR